ncbi:MAG: hypothetical protein FWH14_05490 [Oscillospiraceae bacterium]|nr:hypothetical protein [Oscillospiraceae bacterium]
MSIETRHTEKSILFQLLKAMHTGDIASMESSLRATMEPEDVKLVESEFNKWKEKQSN